MLAMKKHNNPVSSKMKVSQRQLDEFVVGSENLCFLADKTKPLKDYWDRYPSKESLEALKRL
jgi:hypothetical protein